MKAFVDSFGPDLNDLVSTTRTVAVAFAINYQPSTRSGQPPRLWRIVPMP